MAFITDYTLLNNAATSGNWTASGFDSPTLNDSSATTPIYIEEDACMWWPLKKGTTNGYTYTSTITGTPSMTGRLCVGLINYPFADIDNIPISNLAIRVSSSTGFTTNYGQWDAKAQILAPYNTPISGHTPIIVYPENEDATNGTPNYGAIESVGWVATTGNDADGKQGGFDFFFLIGYVGEHSETFTDTFFDDLYEEGYDSDGGGLPGTTSRPLCVVSRSGDFFQFNVKVQLGDGSSDTANTVVVETAKTIFFSNVEPEHELGYVFVDPASTHEVRLTLTDCVHFWTSQQSTHEIFTDVTNATYFKITGCAFTNGGQISLPADSANRWVRSTKFSLCQSGSASDGEFTDCILSACGAMSVSGDADFTGTQVLEPVVAANASGFVWNGAYDPDGNLDGMSFSIGATAHHAIEFGTGSPLTMTLREIDFSGFNSSDGQNDSTFHVKRTSGTVTINVVDCTGNMSYRSDGATVVISNAVAVEINGVSEGAQCSMHALAPSTDTGILAEGTEILNDAADSTGKVSGSFAYTSDQDVVVRARSSGIVAAAIADDGGAFTDETTVARNRSTTNDMTLFPATPVVSTDQYYFGGLTAFTKLKVFVGTAGVGTYALTWEYWNGSTWSTLTPTSADDFKSTGPSEIEFTAPGDWATTSVNSQGPYYYIRCRWTSGTMTTSPVGSGASMNVTKYLPFTQNNTITSGGLTVTAVWVEDTIAT